MRRMRIVPLGSEPLQASVDNPFRRGIGPFNFPALAPPLFAGLHWFELEVGT
jgi:hypothetical protein